MERRTERLQRRRLKALPCPGEFSMVSPPGPGVLKLFSSETVGLRPIAFDGVSHNCGEGRAGNGAGRATLPLCWDQEQRQHRVRFALWLESPLPGAPYHGTKVYRAVPQVSSRWLS